MGVAQELNSDDGEPMGSIRPPYYAGKWQQQLIQLSDRVASGELQFNTLYLIGVFPDRTAAYNVARRFRLNPDSLPANLIGDVVFETRSRSMPSGKTGSELWAGIASDDENDTA